MSLMTPAVLVVVVGVWVRVWRHRTIREMPCYFHHINEPINRASYQRCYECGHVWTARALRKAWRTEWWRISKGDKLSRRVRRYFMPARRIYFCQHCLHDF